jgi:hypothetical protein
MATPLFGFGLARIPATKRYSAVFELHPDPAVNADAPALSATWRTAVATRRLP